MDRYNILTMVDFLPFSHTFCSHGLQIDTLKLEVRTPIDALYHVFYIAGARLTTGVRLTLSWWGWTYRTPELLYFKWTMRLF